MRVGHFDVRPVALPLTRPLRQAVLRPHQTVQELAAQEPPEAFAVGAFAGEELVAVGLIGPDGGPGAWRVRGMATAPEARGQGAGTAVLDALLAHAGDRGATRVWCNARVPAITLYERAGFVVCSEPFEPDHIGPHVVMERDARIETSRPPLAEWLWLAGIVASAAVLRFVSLGRQSYWFDETVTVSLLKHSLSGLLDAIPRSESTPPLYYVLAWGWSKAFGLSEAGLRSFSALAGTAAVPFAWAATRRLISPRAGLIAAALIAVNPMLIWYSQEARAYSLVIFLAAVGIWLFAVALDRPAPGVLTAWAAVSALALATHYFAAFVLLPQVVLLWLRAPPDARRRVLGATAAVGAAGLALIPLAHHQEQDGRTSWIAASDISGRVQDVGRELGSANTGLISSSSGAPHGVWWAVGTIGVLAAIGLLLASVRGRRLRGAGVMAAVGLGALMIPLALSFTPLDFFKDRNLVAAWVPLAAVLAAGLSARRHRVIGAAGFGAIAVASLAVGHQVRSVEDLQRSDWRTVLHALPKAQTGRAIGIYPGYALAPLWAYGHDPQPAAPGAVVHELVLVGQLPASVADAPGAPPGFVRVQRHRATDVTLLRYRSARGLKLTPQVIAAAGRPLYVEPSPAAERWLRVFLARRKAWSDDLAAMRRTAGSALAPDVRRDLSLGDVPMLARPPEDIPVAPDFARRIARVSALGRRIAQTQPRPQDTRAFEAALGDLSRR